MLEILNKLAPFFEDCYRRIGVREYAKLVGISPPTASALLKEYHKQGMLHQQEERRHLLFYANSASSDFIDLSRIYWRKKLEKLSEEVKKTFLAPTAILFGSLAKAEAKSDSDVDIALFAPTKRSINTTKYSKQLKREITIYWFPSLHAVKNKHLANNILNGYIIAGQLRDD